MKCRICGRTATLEITSVDAVSGENTRVPYCAEHAEGAERSAREAAQRKREIESTLQSLAQFVKINRRIPSRDEMEQIEILKIEGPFGGDPYETWTQFAKRLLSDQDDSR